MEKKNQQKKRKIICVELERTKHTSMAYKSTNMWLMKLKEKKTTINFDFLNKQHKDSYIFKCIHPHRTAMKHFLSIYCGQTSHDE